MNDQIKSYAKRLKLSWIKEHFDEVEASSNQEYLLKLFEAEIRQREERRLNLLLTQATLPTVKGKPFDWNEVQVPPGMTKENLLNGEFMEKQENVIFYGGVGVGKTYLATLIGLNAIHKFGKSVKFYTVAGLVNRLLEANEKGTLPKLFKQLEKLDLLILDELGYIPLHKQGGELLFQVISMCYEAKSIIITTILQFGQWNHVFGDPILTEAVIDRLIHHSHLVVFNGDSHRYKESLLQN
ncbi:IS21-like element helper ATPase IstB [Bacillus sp. ISL-47]|uniref:IS21-like element helper ATPase IstB n=1 Tax=Bacillus sp. ISL-47 TaxID=2819130 RepID=UPI001BE5309B|nr:IS21-like element helper ATPase IstB [Bacillus sp. ISL-47]MBT2689234.1 IS21-like element helper ATPase IstB [Bacillus sp. ISL-47]MBT2708644.1 IS21-like element helper ATPase IstB [Pseudomonas sp. ISL-84]